MFELYLLTFNAARNFVDPDALAPPLFDALPPAASVPDLVAISLQEISPIAYSFLGGSFLSPYFDRVTTTVQLAAKLRSHGSESLEHVATRSLGMTGLMLFAKPHLAERIKWTQAAGAGVGFWNMGNKGAVALRIGLSVPDADETLVLTLSAAHLAPMEDNLESRNQDWKSIVRNLVFLNQDHSGFTSNEEAALLANQSDLPEENDGLFSSGAHIFFAGDLNYRTSDTPPGPKSHLTYPQPTDSESDSRHFSQLLQKDQLTREKDAGRTLHQLQELPIKFPPTYKYSMRRNGASNSHKRSPSSGEETWSWAKHRFPSWCDRILFSPLPALDPQSYTALPLQHTSDHRPVALFVRVNDTAREVRAAARSSPEAPFPINPNWKSRRDNARRLEIIVGVLSYLGLTKKGNAILVTFASIAFVTWWIVFRLK